jgi:hypothetical protein
MAYHKFLVVMLVTLILSVVVQGEGLFSDTFFLVAYAMISLILVLGMRADRTYENILGLGFLLLVLSGVLGVWVVIDMARNMPFQSLAFKLGITVVMNLCSMGFVREGRIMKKSLAIRPSGKGETVFWKG